MIQQLKRTTVRSVATAALVVAIAVPVGWALAPAGAAPPAESPAISAGSGPASTTPSGADTRDAARAERRAEREERLAERLGVSTDELRDARLDVLQELLDERVADGRISEERAAQVMDAARSGTLRELRRELRAERAARR